jgi:8-oxo-dGTP diphosphatase
MKHYNVVAAVIKRADKYLCMQKGQTKYPYTSFKYEFPGGKIEQGETPEEALKRELKEEMNYEIDIIRPLITIEQQYPDFAITMEAFLCTASTPFFEMKEHAGFCWATSSEMNQLDWAEADIKVLEAVPCLSDID